MSTTVLCTVCGSMKIPCKCGIMPLPAYIISSDNTQTLKNTLEQNERLKFLFLEANMNQQYLQKSNEQLRDILQECADDLQGELESRYTSRTIYETERRRFERDMAPVYAAREALSLTKHDETGIKITHQSSRKERDPLTGEMRNINETHFEIVDGIADLSPTKRECE